MLQVDPAVALDIQYQSAQLIERINAYFGYRAVANLRIVQEVINTPPRNRERQWLGLLAQKTNPQVTTRTPVPAPQAIRLRRPWRVLGRMSARSHEAASKTDTRAVKWPNSSGAYLTWRSGNCDVPAMVRKRVVQMAFKRVLP